MDTENDPALLMASGAVSVCDTWPDPDKRREQLLALWRASFGAPPGLLAAAAREIASLPKPIPEKVDELDRKDQIRRLLGMRSPQEELLAMLDARDLLEQLAREFG